MRTDKPALQTTFVLEAQLSDLPEDVVEEVRRLWRDYEYGNDSHYHTWDFYDGGEVTPESEEYPLIAQYLRDKNITECLIHWWW